MICKSRGPVPSWGFGTVVPKLDLNRQDVSRRG